MASNINELLKLLQEAAEELEELRASVEYDEEFMSDAHDFLPSLETSIKQTIDGISSGQHQFDGENLPFMEYVSAANRTLLPFKFLFTRINDLHLLMSEENDAKSGQ